MKHVDHIFGRHIARCPRCIGTSPQPGNGSINRRHARFHAGEDIGEGLAVCVVEMQGQSVHRDVICNRVDHGAGTGRGADPNRVAQTNFVAPYSVERPGHTHHIFQRYVAFIRTAQNTGNITAHLDPGILCFLRNRLKTLDTFFDGTIDILLGEGL